MPDWDVYMDTTQSPFTKFLKPYDPFEGLPRRLIKGTHPRKAKLYMRAYRSLLWLSRKITVLAEQVDLKAEDFVPPRVWSDHSDVDWDQVSPEERKRRTTIIWSSRYDN